MFCVPGILRPRFYAVLLLPLVCSIVSTGLFFWQGGFGGGHGKFDFYIFLLALPSILLLEVISVPTVFDQSDLVLVIWLPAFLNFLFLALFASIIYYYGRCHRDA